MGNVINQYEPESVTPPYKTLVEKLKELNMGNKEFAIRVGKPEKTISALTQGKSAITADMAVKFEDVLQIPASFWLTRQRRYDEYRARVKRVQEIEQAKEWARGFPYVTMANFGWVPPARKVEEQVMALFNFFGVSTHRSWEAYYFDQALKVSFRISLAHTNEAMAVAAWLRQGELKAKEQNAPGYDAGALKKSIASLRKIMVEHPDGFFEQVQQICLAAGVKVVYTPCLPKAPVNGCARWIGDTPLIQLSARYKTNDKFWFTLFHEIGHLLLHGKKYISIENISYHDQDNEKEREADSFAVKNTFSLSQEQEVIEALPLKGTDILRFAEKFETHPALIIGRLHRKGLLPYSVGREFMRPVHLEEN